MFCLVSLTTMVGQTNAIEVNYSLTLKPIKSQAPNAEFVKSIVKSLKPYEDRITYQLIVNQGLSRFKTKPIMDSDLNPGLLPSLQLHADANTVYYQNQQDEYYYKFLHSRSFSGIVIKDHFKKFNWRIDNQKIKTILGYKCYLATASFSADGIKKNIKVWFSPKININSGPMYYNGLPGLILAYQDRHRYLEAKKISFNSIKTIKQPKVEQYYTEDEFLKLVKNKMKRFGFDPSKK